jgi:hypothetical protein
VLTTGVSAEPVSVVEGDVCGAAAVGAAVDAVVPVFDCPEPLHPAIKAVIKQSISNSVNSLFIFFSLLVNALHYHYIISLEGICSKKTSYNERLQLLHFYVRYVL